MAESPNREDSSSESGPVRRNFLMEFAAAVTGGVVGLVPLLAGLFSFLDPLRKKDRTPEKFADAGGGKEGFLRVCSLEALSVSAPPQRFPVIADQTDAWNFTPNQPIGSVYVQRVEENKLLVFNTTCPHAGCSVSCDGLAYNCPCHNSSFELNGSKKVSESGRENPSPRDLDSLEYEVQDGEVWVQFMQFFIGRHEKKPKQ